MQASWDFLLCNSGDGVIDISLIKGMAAQETAKGKPAAPQNPVFVDSFVSVCAAGGPEPAPGRETGGDVLLIEADKFKK
jgi:hypothetical protein